MRMIKKQICSKSVEVKTEQDNILSEGLGTSGSTKSNSNDSSQAVTQEIKLVTMQVECMEDIRKKYNSEKVTVYPDIKMEPADVSDNEVESPDVPRLHFIEQGNN